MPSKLRLLFVTYLVPVKFMASFGSIEIITRCKTQEKKFLKNGLHFLTIITMVNSIPVSLMPLLTKQGTTPLRISTLVDTPFRRYCHTVGLKHSRKDKTLVQQNNLQMWAGSVRVINLQIRLLQLIPLETDGLPVLFPTEISPLVQPILMVMVPPDNFL